MKPRHATIPAALAAAAIIASGCGSSGSSKATHTASTKTMSTTMSGSSHAAQSTGTPSTATTSKATDTRVKLDELLAEHSMLATAATQAGLAGSPAFPSALATLKQNGTDLAAVVGSVYGAAAGKQFDTMWQDHIGYLVDYTVATAKHDASAKQLAVKHLDTYTAKFGSFLATATGLPVKAVQGEIQAHVQQHAGIIDATATKDYAAAWKLQRASYQHMISIGDTLAGAITKQKHLDDGGVSAAAGDTRVKLDTLLGEHTALATAATTKALAAAPDYAATAAALGANSSDLADVIGSVYGDAAKAAFAKQWTAHVGYLVDYTTAVAKGDATAKAKAVAELDGYVGTFGDFLATATGAPAQPLKDALKAHVQQHAGVIDDYHAKRYAQADALARGAYAHMFDIGDVLTAAIVKQHPEKFAS